MIGKNNIKKQLERRGEKVETYSIKKFKVGAASVLIGVGLFFGAGVVEASDSTTVHQNGDKKVADSTETSGPVSSVVEVKPAEKKVENTREKVAEAVAEKLNPEASEKAQQKVDKSLLLQKIEELKAQLERVKNNTKQKSVIDEASKKLESAEALLENNPTQEEVDKKAKEISSITNILKSIKAEETTPKENKNQDSRNGKKLEEGTGFRTGVTTQALTGAIHFDTSKGPTEKNIPVANNGDGERVINMAITYSASSTETVTGGKVRVTIPKEFLHSTKKPEFANSSFVKSVDDLSTATNYIYDLNLNPMSGGTVAESLLKLYVGTSIKNAPSKGDALSVTTDFIAGGETLSTKSARATFDYLSEILYREKDTRPKTVKHMVDQFGAPLPEFKMGSVSNGTFKPIEGNTFKLPFIMSDQSFFNNEETTQNGNGRLTSYDYTISGIPDFLELDPTNIKNNKFWTLENGVLTLHPDEKKGIDQSLLYGGPILKVKEGAFNTPEAIKRVIETNSTKGFNANIVYKAVGHRPDGSTFTQTLENPDGFRFYLGDGIPAIKELDTRIYPETNQRLFSNASNEDTFNARFYVPSDKLKGDGAFLPSQYINYFIPKDQEGNYFTKFQLNRVYTNEIKADGSKAVRGYYREQLDGNLKENFKLYGVTKDNQAELLKEYTSINELYDTIEINPEKKYKHLILKHPGIVDEFQKYNSTSKTITGLESRLGVTVGTWKEKAQDKTIQRYDNKIAQGFTSDNTIESAIAMERPATGSGDPAWHVKTPTKLSLDMNQIGSQTLTKDQLTRGKTIPIAVTYSAPDYFSLAETDKNGVKTYDLNKLDPNITKTSVMLLADPKLPLKDFRLAADNRLLSKYVLHFGGANGRDAQGTYDKLKESYDTVNPTKIIENYNGTGKRAYIFDSKNLGLTKYDLNKDGWLKGGLYSPTALTFEVENNGQVEAGTYGIESYLVWNSESETLVGNDNSINANFVENHAPGLSISKANINVTINNVAEYSTSLTIAKPGTTGVRGIIDVKNGQEVVLSPQIENLTDTPQKVKEAVVLIPKTEALTYLEGPITNDSDEYDVVYTTSTATDKTTGTYVTADQITNWKDVTAVKYVFKNNYTVTKEHAFKHHFNLRVDQNNPNYVQSTSQIFLKDGKDTWLESNVVGLRTEDVRGKLEVYYKTVDGELLKEFPTTKDFEGKPYATTKEPILKGFVNKWYAVHDYIFIEVQPDSAPETGTYERQVTKKVTYLYDQANVKVETKEITRTINYIEKNNEGNIISSPVTQKVTVSRKVYTGEKTGRVVEEDWEIPANAKWESVTSPTPSEWEKPEVKVNDQYIAKAAIDEVRITPEVLNNGNIVENVYYERIVPIGGDVVAKYVIEGTTTELKPATDVAKGLKVGKSYTSTAPVAGEELTATDGKVYVYKGHKATSAGEQGTVTADKQEVVYEYAPKVGGNVIAKYVIKGTTTELKASTNVSTGAQVGSEYTATAPQAGEVLKQGELEYVLEGRKADSAAETGKVTADTQEIIYEYVPKQGGNVIAKYVIKGTTTELKASTNVSTGAQVGSEYTATAPQAGEVLKQGELEYVLEGRKADSAAETGKVTADTQEIIYEYVPKQGGNVEVKYVIAGTETNLKDPVTLVTNGQVGSDYTATKENTITKDGLVYELVKTNNGLKEGSATETGKVTEAKQEVVYEYAPKVGGNVEVKYVIAGTETNLKDPVTLVTNGQVGSDYTATKENTITKDGLVYELVKTNNGLKEGSATETGKVTEAKQEVVYEYAPKVGGNVEVKYVIAGTEENLKDPVALVTNGQIGSDYTATKDATITKEDGRVYKLVAANNGLKTGSAGETGQVTTEKQTVTYEYELQKGDVTVNYTDVDGQPIEGKTSVKAETQSSTGKEYNTNTPDLKPETITTESGKVYKLVPAQTVGKETGKVTVEPTEVTYKYELQKGDVTVNYTDTEGNAIEGKTSVKAETQSPTGKEYNTNTPDLKPETITTESGKVYKLVPAQTVGKETGKVTVEPTEVTYKYELQKGDVTVNYTDTEGNAIEGKTSVKAETQSPTGKEYNTNTPDLKPETITTANGDVYEFVKKSETSASETGKVNEGVTTVEYVYRKVVTTYVDETGKEINSSDKGTKDKKDIPEYIYKETKKDEKGNTTHVYRQVVTSYVDEEGKEINPSDKGMKDKKEISGYTFKETKKDKDGNTTHVYRQVVTSYVDEEGKEINPSDKGTKDKKDIPEYTFKQTKKDKDGNTIHVYTKKSSSTPETPKPTPETPNTDESKSTIWKSVDGETLKPRENGTKDKSSIPGYEFVRTEKDKEGNTVHIYRKVTSSTPEVKEKETSYVDENGKEIRSPKKGTHPKETIPGYEFVRTETDANGNVRHVYRQVAQSSATVEKRKNELPNTGTGDEFTIFGAAAASILAGLGIAIPGKKKEE